MQRPEDFSLTFGYRLDSWEREHCFTTAADCFDYFVCDSTGKSSAVEWAGNDFLQERRFVLDLSQLERLWCAVVKLKLKPETPEYTEEEVDQESEFFVRARFNDVDHVLIARGKSKALSELMDTVAELIAPEQGQQSPPSPASDSTKAIRLAQASWRFENPPGNKL